MYLLYFVYIIFAILIYYNLENIYKYKGDMEKAKEMKYWYIKVFNDVNKNKKPLDINL